MADAGVQKEEYVITIEAVRLVNNKLVIGEPNAWHGEIWDTHSGNCGSRRIFDTTKPTRNEVRKTLADWMSHTI